MAMLCGWLQGEQEDVIAFLREENRLLKARLNGRRLGLNGAERRRLGELGHRLGRRVLEVATIVTADTILRWHRALVAQKWTCGGGHDKPHGLHARIRALVIRMATENPTWGYTRIQGALKNVGHKVGRSTVARILKAGGIPPSRERPLTWRAFIRAHWSALLTAAFFTMEVWTHRGLLTYYTAFVIELHSRRVPVLGSAQHPDEAFVVQAFRGLASDSHILRAGQVLICDRIRSGVPPSAYCSNPSAFASFARRRQLRTAMRTRSDSSGRSKPNASIASCRWANGTFGVSYESLSVFHAHSPQRFADIDIIQVRGASDAADVRWIAGKAARSRSLTGFISTP